MIEAVTTITSPPGVQPGAANYAAAKPQPISRLTKTKKPAKAKTPRVIDPEIQRLRDEHNEAVKALHDKRRSAGILKTIIDKRLSQMTLNDRTQLFDALREIVTPALPMEGGDK